MNKVIAIVGPTASGKTDLAIKMAKELDTEIISADSRLVYRGFDIATAKPTKEEQAQVKHHLIDIVEPEVDYSVANFHDDAKKVIDKLHKENKIPIVVGGTGLYFRILLENYKLPGLEADYKLRAELGKFSNEELFSQLIQLDEASSKKIHLNDRVRLIRALEVIKISGKPFSQISELKEEEYDVQWLFPDTINTREELYTRINLRVDKMVANGLIDETKYLLNKHGRIKNLVNTIGYQEIIEYLDKKIALDEAIEKIKLNTRHYAKRQLTWFRKNPNLNFSI